MSIPTDSEFGRFKKIFWPIHSYELKKFLPMVGMMFLFLFNYTILRDTKDTLVVTHAGAEVIPFLKFWGTLPLSVLFVLVYAKLSNILKPTTLFYSMVTPFLVFYIAFGFIIYPNLDILKPDLFTSNMETWVIASLPEQMHPTLIKIVKIINVWPYAIFYISAELWGSMGISLLFWQFANQITKTQEAKRFYAGFAQLGNLALVASGLTIIYFSDIRDKVPTGVDAWGLTLQWLMGAIAIGCITIISIYWWMNKYVLTDKRFYDSAENYKAVKNKKTKLGLKESFLFLIRSKYLGCIAVLVLAYGVSINLIEVVWKGQLGLQFPNQNDYNTFMGYFSMCTGIVTLLLVTIGSNIIRRAGWYVAALAAPTTILATGGLFFFLVFFKDSVSSWLPFTALWFAVIIGAIQNILSKATKYSLFDPTKEMAYIPLDSESKTKGKAAIDVVGARMGKSGGGLVLQIVLMFGAILDNLAIIFGFVTIIIAAWIKAVNVLNKLYNSKLAASKIKSETANETTINITRKDKVEPQTA